MSKSQFARKQLQKYGWKEGAGLGKDEDGRSEAIKVSLKMDKAGVGHEPGKEFTDHWWLRVFNDAAKKIGNKKEDTIESSEDRAKKEKADKKAQFYKGFVKSSLLANGVEEKHEEAEVIENDGKDESDHSSIPTLDDIHKYCGGATGHRAAMFGIKMKGKLSRVARHDLQFEEQQKQKEKMSQSGDISVLTDDSRLLLLSDKIVSDGEEKPKTKHKKKKKKLNKEEAHEEIANSNGCNSFEESSGDPEKQIKTKKKKKDKRSIEKSAPEGSESEELLNHSKCSQEHLTVDEHVLNSADVRSCDSPKQKKRKKRKSEKNSDRISEFKPGAEEQTTCSAEGLEISSISDEGQASGLEASETSEGGQSRKKRKREKREDSKQTCEHSEEYKEKHRKKKRKKNKTD